jgi:hypothetical protein
MHVSWEALTAVASLFSSVVVLAAVLVAIRQVRVGAEQVEHLRKATQLEGTMKIFAILGSPEMQKARRFISLELAERMKDPVFRAEVPLLTMAPSVEDHGELAILRLMEMIGVYVKHGLLDPEIVFDYWIPAIVYGWEQLEAVGVIAIHRDALGAAMWENFEDLYRRGKRWTARDSFGKPDEGWGPRHTGEPPRPDRNEVVADAPAS